MHAKALDLSGVVASVEHIAAKNQKLKQYYLAELKKVLEAAEHEATLPPKELTAGKDVLDIGSGGGATMSRMAANGANSVTGIEPDEFGCTMSNIIFPDATVINGFGEQLFPDLIDKFDVVIFRVSINYMDVRRVLRNAYQYTKPGGQVWVLTHGAGKLSDKLRNPQSAKSFVYWSWVALNSFIFAVSGRQLKWNDRPAETVQWTRSLGREFRSAGFTHFAFEPCNSTTFIAIARK